MAAYVKFDSQHAGNVWGMDEGDPLSIEVVYERAKPYLLQWKEELISEHGYSSELLSPAPEDDDDLLMSLSSCDPAPPSTAHRCLFILPQSAQEFASNSSKWDPVFASLHVAQHRHESGDLDLVLDEPPPLRNIFCLLQTMFDGMLSLVMRVGKTDKPERTVHHMLPGKEWIQQNSDILKDVLGLSSTTEIEEVAEDQGVLVSDIISDKYESDEDDYDHGRDWDREDDYGRGWDYDLYRNSSDGEELDYTACSAHDCGYCGKCPY